MIWGCRGSSKRNESPSFTRFFGTLSIIIAPFFLIRYHYRSCSKDLQTQWKKEKRDLEEGKGKKKKKSQDNIQIVVYYQSPCFLVRWTSCHYITINILSHMTLLVGAQGILGFPCGSAGKESSCNEGDLSLIPGLWRFPWKRERLSTPVLGPGEVHGLLVHGVTKSWTRLSDFHFQGLLIEWWKTLKSK